MPAFAHIPRLTIAQKKEGFALLVTIVLLAFLVLLIVSLATLSRVETSAAGNSQQQEMARQNALMALNVALGQLQKYTGPDQRVTAAADIASAADGTRLPDGAPAQNTQSVNGTANGLDGAASGTRWWTGVWGRAGADYAVPAKSIYEETPSPVLLNWLVSGNEDRVFSTDKDGLVESSSADGRSAGDTAAFTPARGVDWNAAALSPADPSAWSSGNYAKLAFQSSGEKGVLLVGPGSAGVDPDNGEAAVDRYVVAPLRDISADAPGVAGQATIGRYAWWVGDEGTKADYALVDPHPQQNSPANSGASGAGARLRLMAASHSGIELLTGFGGYPRADDAAGGAQLDKLLDVSQLPLLSNAPLPETRRARFHDLAVDTAGLLSNTLDGGLRTDLTYYFESSAHWNGSPLFGEGIIPQKYSPKRGPVNLVPKWDLLYSFYNTNPASLGAPSLTVRPETDSEVGVFPVVTQLRFIVFTEDSRITNPKALPPETDFSLPVRANVAIVLANPYNVALQIPPNGMELLLKNEYTAAASDGLAIRAALGSGKGDELKTFGIMRAPGSTLPDGLIDTVGFTVPACTIPPGEAITLAVEGNGQSIDAHQSNPGNLNPANAVALSVRGLGNPLTSSDYFSANTTLDFSTPAADDGTAGIALYQWNSDLSLTLRRPSDGVIYQKIEHFEPMKGEGQLGSFSGTVLGSVHLKFIAPAQRLMDWSSGDVKSAFFGYTYGRPYQDFNIRAKWVTHPRVYYTTNATNYGTYVLIAPPSYGAGVIKPAAGGNAGGDIFSAFTDSLHPAAWAEDFSDYQRNTAGQGVLFDFPRRATGQLPVLSLAQFQHASLSVADESLAGGGTLAYEPAYAVGNSYSHPYITRGAAVQAREDLSAINGGSGSTTNYFDMSYLLNTALWDGYFFSGIPQSGGDYQPLNPRFALSPEATAAMARSADSAAWLGVKGAFNVNSTSVAAWVALLGSLNERRVNGDLTDEGVPYPRTLWQPENSVKTGASYQSSGTGNKAYAGYRRLTGDEIHRLADEIVKRVRARGPFVSLSHFINRSLVAASDDFNPAVNDADKSGNLAAPTVPMGRGFSGPLQAAIDSAASRINTFVSVGGYRVTGDAAGAYGDRVLFNGEVSNSLNYKPDDYYNKPGSANTRGPLFADKKFDAPSVDWRMNVSAKPGATGRTSTAIPGWLLQGDLLQAIGPALSARSDTFVIRAYGEVVNPSDPDEVRARAWCEAIVQRIPDYVDPAKDAATTAPGALSSAENHRFGRAYKIVRFRWLSPSDV